MDVKTKFSYCRIHYTLTLFTWSSARIYSTLHFFNQISVKIYSTILNSCFYQSSVTILFNQSSAYIHLTDVQSNFTQDIHYRYSIKLQLGYKLQMFYQGSERIPIRSKYWSKVHIGYTLQIFNQSSARIYFTDVQSKFSQDILYCCSIKVQPGYTSLMFNQSSARIYFTDGQSKFS